MTKIIDDIGHCMINPQDKSGFETEKFLGV